MVSINLLSGISLEESNKYKNTIKEELNGPNRKTLIALLSKSFKDLDRPRVSRSFLASIEGSGYEETKGLGYDDKLKVSTYGGGIFVSMEYSLSAVPLRKVWLKEYIISELKKERESK